MNARLGWLAFAVVLILTIAWLLRSILPVVILSAIYATVTWPLVQRLETRVPRVLAIVIVNSLAAAAFVAVCFAAGPTVYGQVRELIAASPRALVTFADTLPTAIQAPLIDAFSRVDVSLVEWVRGGLQATFAILRSAAAVAGAVVLIPVLAAYLQIDAERYAAAFYALVPIQYNQQTQRALREISSAIGGFVRGQILVSTIVGILVYLVLLLCGVRYAGAIAFFTAVLDVVPYLGGIAAFVPSLLFALAYQGIGRAVLVVVLLTGVFGLEAQLLSPQIIGSKTHVPASVVVLSLLAGTALFGVVGLYVAIPMAATVGAVARELVTSQNAASRTARRA